MRTIEPALLTQLQGPAVEFDRLRERMPDPDVYGFERQEYISIPADLIDPVLFRHPAHASLAAYWATERDRNGGIPLSERFDPSRVVPALGFLLMLEPNADASDFRYRLYGTEVASHHGRDMTGQWLSAFNPPGPIVFGTQYRAVVECRVAVYAEHDADIKVSYCTRWCRLALPMAGPDDRIDRVVVCNVPIRRTIGE